MNYRAIIFDLDGTIADTNHIWDHATRSLLTEKSVIITPEIEYDLRTKISGLALPYSCKMLKDMFSLEESVEEIMQKHFTHLVTGYQEKLSFIRGFVTFHRKATKQFGLLSGVATNSDDTWMIITKEKLRLERFFGRHIYNISAVNNVPKPYPDLYLHVASQLNVAPEECIAIEDSQNGLNAAKNAGMFCIGLNSGKNRELLAKSDFTVDYYRQIDLPRLFASKK